MHDVKIINDTNHDSGHVNQFVQDDFCLKSCNQSVLILKQRENYFYKDKAMRIL